MPRNDITVLAQLRLHPDFVEEGMRNLLRFAQTVRRNEKACTAIEIVQDLDDPTLLTMIEKWTDRAAYEGPHLQSAHMKAFIEQSGRYFDGKAMVSFGRSTEIDRDDYRSRAPYPR